MADTQVAFANLTLSRVTAVNYRNPARAPLLLIAGGEDHIVPPSLTRAIYDHHRKSGAVTEYGEFPGRSHAIAGEAGWEEVADYALDWALRQAGQPARRVA